MEGRMDGGEFWGTPPPGSGAFQRKGEICMGTLSENNNFLFRYKDWMEEGG